MLRVSGQRNIISYFQAHAFSLIMNKVLAFRNPNPNPKTRSLIKSARFAIEATGTVVLQLTGDGIYAFNFKEKLI